MLNTMTNLYTVFSLGKGAKKIKMLNANFFQIGVDPPLEMVIFFFKNAFKQKLSPKASS